MTAAEMARAEAAAEPTASTTTTSAAVATSPTTTTRRPDPSTSTTVRRTTTRAAATPYSPAPPPAGVEPDGYGGYGGVTRTSSGGGSTVTLSVYPREQHAGEHSYIWATVTGKEAVKSLTIDFGNGHVVTTGPLDSSYCPMESRSIGLERRYVYPTSGRYRVTATAVIVPCMILTGPPEGTIGPDGTPWVIDPSRLVPTGVAGNAVTAAMDTLQRAEPPPPPVGPPPGP